MILDLELVDRFGRNLIAQMVVRRDTVEVRCQDRLVGICDRDRMREWLRAPQGQLDFDETSLLPVPGGVALGIESTVDCWPLAGQTVEYIRTFV